MDPQKKKRFLNVPNYITSGRLLAVPVVIILMALTTNGVGTKVLSPVLSLVVAAIFILAMVSDIIDGYYARKHNISSTFGKFIDPLADKLLYLSIMIMMIPLGRIPAWVVVLFFLREVTITALRGIAVDSRIVIAASQWGKYKSIFVTVACSGLLIHYPFFGIHWRLIGWLFMIPAFLFSIGSGVHYIVGFIRAIIKEPPDQINPVSNF